MDEKKVGIKGLELTKANSKVETLKKSFSGLKIFKAKSGLKNVCRSRTQKGHKNY